jgi:glycosyltransferase involved in cell wall biosynthesis
MSDKLKILFITDGLGNGGKERQLIEIIKHLNGEKYSKYLLTFNSNQHYTETAKKSTELFYYIDKSKSKLDPFFYIFEIIERLKPDILYAFDLLSVIYAYIPSMIYKKGMINASIQDTFADMGYQRSAKKYFLKKSDLVIANSIAGLEAYGVNGEVLYNIIDSSRFKPRKESKEFTVVMVANFTKYKDYKNYLELVKYLIENGVINKAYAVGEGIYLKSYKELVNDYASDIKSKIIFTGRINNIEEFLCDKNIGILFSTEKYGEGISNSILEYMASGLIPIISDIGASREIVNDGVNGYLVNKYDKESITSIIRELRTNSNLYSRIQESAINTVREQYDVKRNIALLEKCFENIMYHNR